MFLALCNLPTSREKKCSFLHLYTALYSFHTAPSILISVLQVSTGFAAQVVLWNTSSRACGIKGWLIFSLPFFLVSVGEMSSLEGCAEVPFFIFNASYGQALNTTFLT